MRPLDRDCGNESFVGLASHIARWDLDKTYLRTEFDSLRDLVKTALERPDQKRTNPGASTLLREMVRAGIRVHILSGSPEQMRKNLEDKLRLDGITWDSFTLKPNLQNLLRLRFRAVRDQLGYKLPALLRARAALADHGEAPATIRETLFGDDAEADAYVYSLYADLLAGRIGEDVVMRVLQRGRVYEDVVAESLGAARTIERADVVERILIHLERQTPPDEFRPYGPRVVPFYNYLQAAFVLQEDGRLGADGVLRVAVELVTEHRVDGDSPRSRRRLSPISPAEATFAASGSPRSGPRSRDGSSADTCPPATSSGLSAAAWRSWNRAPGAGSGRLPRRRRPTTRSSSVPTTPAAGAFDERRPFESPRDGTPPPRRNAATSSSLQVQWPARRAAASMVFTFGPSASRNESSSSSSMIASPKPAAISMAVERMRRNWAKLDAASTAFQRSCPLIAV